MGYAITLSDETTEGKIINKTELRLVSERITLRELISKRIQQEVNKHNSQQHEIFFGLVQPTDTEEKLNGYRMQKPRLVSYDKQIELAFQAFEANGFFVLLDNKQLSELDDEITLSENSCLSFIKLVPLVGG